jgi:hypothetical protein
MEKKNVIFFECFIIVSEGFLKTLTKNDPERSNPRKITFLKSLSHEPSPYKSLRGNCINRDAISRRRRYKPSRRYKKLVQKD